MAQGVHRRDDELIVTRCGSIRASKGEDFYRREQERGGDPLVNVGVSGRGIEEHREFVMANPRQDVQEAGKKITEETSRAARRMAEAGEQTARASADVAQRNSETFQHAWESGSELASDIARRSSEQLARAFGIGGEGTEKAAEQSSRNLEAIVRSGNILAQGAQEVSREYFELARKAVAHNFEWFDALARCRTPQDLVAAQSKIWRDNLQDLLDTTRRTAEVSVRIADDAARRMSETAEETARRTG
jgi:phasin family protein